MPQIEYVTLAHHAEAVNGLLYLQGAGWTDLEQPIDGEGNLGMLHLGIGVSITIGWNETNRNYPLTISVEHEDGEQLFAVEGSVEAGRPAGATPGADLRSVLAVGRSADRLRIGDAANVVQQEMQAQNVQYLPELARIAARHMVAVSNGNPPSREQALADLKAVLPPPAPTQPARR